MMEFQNYMIIIFNMQSEFQAGLLKQNGPITRPVANSTLFIILPTGRIRDRSGRHPQFGKQKPA
jgi:hypothetical protein